MPEAIILEECTPESLSRTLLTETAAQVAAATTPEEAARLTEAHERLAEALRPHLERGTCTSAEVE
ncbi:hypothetical protein [Deinococcus enclensis]|uniref:Uncharacterized protein n=1 Tax=Deinococcus enclensis TaxID=1049582 RepID=A0ABT9MD18_9DEIO|nr:hypothetical protein [Deinococcus enclensis]MDP9764464.1 hypothetical protein [Deinococcus enclensis]